MPAVIGVVSGSVMGGMLLAVFFGGLGMIGMRW